MGDQLRDLPTVPDAGRLGLAFAYGLYAASALLSLVFVARFLSETKGRQLEDMA